MKIKTFLKYTIPLGIAVCILYFAFKNTDTDPAEFVQRAAEVDYSWVIYSIIISLISHWFRSYRWNLLIEPFGYNLKTGRTFLAVMTGYMANLALPRIGEVTKCGIMKKNDNVPVSLSIGTVITERVVDLIALIFIVLLDFIIEFDKVFDFFFTTLGLKSILENRLLIAIGLIILLVLAIAGFMIVRYFIRTESESEFINKVRQFVKQLMDGLLSLRSVRNVPGFILSTIGIWGTYYLMSYIIVFAIGETSELGLAAGLSILVAGSIAMIMPVQGGIGTYHTFITGILVIYSINEKTGLFFASLLHASQVVSILFFGSICVLITAFISKNKVKVDNATHSY